MKEKKMSTIQTCFSELEIDMNRFIENLVNYTPESLESILKTYEQFKTLADLTQAFGPSGYLLSVRSYQWLLHRVLTWSKKNQFETEESLSTLIISISLSILKNIKTASFLLSEPEKYHCTLESSFNIEEIGAMLKRDFSSYFSFYLEKIGVKQHISDEIQIHYDHIINEAKQDAQFSTKKTNDLVNHYNSMINKKIDEIIQEVLDENKLPDLSKLILLIEETENRQGVFETFQKRNVIHKIFEHYNENEILSFLLKFSESIDINAIDKGKTTLLHLIASKHYSKIAHLIFNTKINLLAPPDLYAMDSEDNLPIDLVNDGQDTQFIFEEAMKKELLNGVLLVHPLQLNSIIDCLYKNKKDQLVVFDAITGSFNNLQTTLNAIIKDDTMLTDEGVVGRHLDFENHLYNHSFVDRPHIHWWWNGLFQANSGGNWEDSLVAYIEPLKNIQHVMGCAPYDTMTVGPHQLGIDSCILVPINGVSALKERLSSYKGLIIGFDPQTTSLRAAVYNTIQEHYPDAFELINKNGQNINTLALSDGVKFNHQLCSEQDYNNRAGYFRDVYIKTKQQTALPLIKGANEIKLHSYRSFATGKYIGLHRDAPTDIELNSKLNILKNVSNDPQKIKQYEKHFIGTSGIRLIENLCSVEAYTVYKKLLRLDKNTGIHTYADYLIKKALIAELRAIQYELYKTPIDTALLKKMVEDNYALLLEQLHILFNASRLEKKITMEEHKQSLINDFRTCILNIYHAEMSHPLNIQDFEEEVPASTNVILNMM